MRHRFTAIDLFAGIGGFRTAVDRCGGDTIAFSEINQDAISTYSSNYPESHGTNLGDVTLIRQLPPHDLLTAGVPCQSWSIAGRNLGFDDDRGQLWNDALYLLNQSKPKAFIFENVKGLSDPRNGPALDYIMSRIKDAGYSATYHVLNSFDYGVPQSRVRIYIIGFRDPRYNQAFRIPTKSSDKVRLRDIIEDEIIDIHPSRAYEEPTLNLFGEACEDMPRTTSLSRNNNGFNDYFLFNDIRNGSTTIHSWDIISTTERQKEICLTLLRNRRKKDYGPLDGNPLSLTQLQAIDKTITSDEIDELLAQGIIKSEDYAFKIISSNALGLTDDELFVLDKNEGGIIVPDKLVKDREIRVRRIKVRETLASLMGKQVVDCCEVRYDFRQTKISTGLFGIGRVFLPSSDIFPTLVASDTNDYLTNISITAANEDDYKRDFITHVLNTHRYRRISRLEAIRIQGFPDDFSLPESRARWMKLIGNSVAIPVVESLVCSIMATGVFND